MFRPPGHSERCLPVYVRAMGHPHLASRSRVLIRSFATLAAFAICAPLRGPHRPPSIGVELEKTVQATRRATPGRPASLDRPRGRLAEFLWAVHVFRPSGHDTICRSRPGRCPSSGIAQLTSPTPCQSIRETRVDGAQIRSPQTTPTPYRWPLAPVDCSQMTDCVRRHVMVTDDYLQHHPTRTRLAASTGCSPHVGLVAQPSSTAPPRPVTTPQCVRRWLDSFRPCPMVPSMTSMGAASRCTTAPPASTSPRPHRADRARESWKRSKHENRDRGRLADQPHRRPVGAVTPVGASGLCAMLVDAAKHVIGAAGD